MMKNVKLILTLVSFGALIISAAVIAVYFSQPRASAERLAAQATSSVISSAEEESQCEITARSLAYAREQGGAAGFCGRLSGFLLHLQGLVRADDCTSLSKLVRYPLDGDTEIKNNREFVEMCADVFTSPMRQDVLDANIGDAFITSQGIMIANGFWIQEEDSGDFAGSSPFMIVSL